MSWIKNLLLILVVIIFSSLLLEFGSRLIFLISPGPKLMDSSQGIQLKIPFNEPNSEYRQVFAEYNVPTKIDSLGNRVTPASASGANTTILFLGDSFTFGQGVADIDTIPNYFCTAVNAQCVNLGVPGTGLVKQFEKLSDYLSKNNLSTNVLLYHLILASTEARHSGNDITDTLRELNEKNESVQAKYSNTEQVSKKDSAGALIRFARWLSVNSNAFRVLRTVFGNQLRHIAWSNAENAFTNDELAMFSRELNRITDKLKKNKIIYNPVLLSTFSEVDLNKRELTERKLKSLTNVDLVKIDYQKRNYSSFFFPLDGHANAKGNSFIATQIVEHFLQSSK